MKIGFLISGVGVYGSVREIVENGNVWIELGHDVTIYNPESDRITWIPFKGKVKYENELKNDFNDVLILTTSPNDKYTKLLSDAKADKKVFCFMGFDPKFNVFDLNPNLKFIIDNYWITADSYWQIEYMKPYAKNIIESQIGGINTEMFKPIYHKERNKLNIGWSGDLRKRKGGITLHNFFDEKKLKTETYFNKGITQDKMKDWFAGVDVFIDNHYSGGWCNPVAEAMACKIPVICSETECNSGFAIDNLTALKFAYNDMDGMYNHLVRLINNKKLRTQIAEQGYNYIQKFDYKIIAKNFLQWL